MDKFDVVVIGAGVIGLAIAAELSQLYPNVLLIEKNTLFGEETSSRNSEVIHGGLYYPHNSLKAKLCVSGKELLYQYCKDFKVPLNNIGKILVATGNQEQEKLDAIVKQSQKNGVDDLTYLTNTQLTRLEPNVSADSAVLSPSTGIVDSHQLMLSLLGLFEKRGGTYVTQTQFLAAQPGTDGFTIKLNSQVQELSISADILINAAGLEAQAVASSIVGIKTNVVPRLYLCKGCYFNYSGKAPFSRLIYPMPNQFGLGIHATLDLAGQVRFGPDVEYLEQQDFDVQLSKRGIFYHAIKSYFPDAEIDRLTPAYAGIRPKLQAPDSNFEDFYIQSADDHGIQGLINLYGIESPGLTASLAIAKYVKKLL